MEYRYTFGVAIDPIEHQAIQWIFKLAANPKRWR